MKGSSPFLSASATSICDCWGNGTCATRCRGWSPFVKVFTNRLSSGVPDGSKWPKAVPFPEPLTCCSTGGAAEAGVARTADDARNSATVAPAARRQNLR